MTSTKLEPRPIIGFVVERSLHQGPGRELWSGSVAEHPEAESFLAFGCSKDQTNLPLFRNFC